MEIKINENILETYNILENESDKKEYSKAIIEYLFENKKYEGDKVIVKLAFENSVKMITKLNKTEVKNQELVEKVIDYLNKVTNAKKGYLSTSKKTISLINARVKEGKYKFSDFAKVIDNKHNDWKDTEYYKYMRPETLFGTKFESYLNEIPVKKNNKNTDYNERQYSEEEVSEYIKNKKPTIIGQTFEEIQEILKAERNLNAL